MTPWGACRDSSCCELADLSSGQTQELALGPAPLPWGTAVPCRKGRLRSLAEWGHGEQHERRTSV